MVSIWRVPTTGSTSRSSTSLRALAVRSFPNSRAKYSSEMALSVVVGVAIVDAANAADEDTDSSARHQRPRGAAQVMETAAALRLSPRGSAP